MAFTFWNIFLRSRGFKVFESGKLAVGVINPVCVNSLASLTVMLFAVKTIYFLCCNANESKLLLVPRFGVFSFSQSLPYIFLSGITHSWWT